MTYTDLKDKYTDFIYDKYEINDINNTLEITYYFEIKGLKKFNPKLIINKSDIKNKDINKDFLNDLVFHIGMIELISYYKCCLPKNIIINAGYLNESQIKWFKKLYYYGLGEFFYQNNIKLDENSFVNIICNNKKINYEVEYHGIGNLIPVGGGKDSIVTLNLLKNEDNLAFVINPRSAHIDTIKTAKVDSIQIIRKLDGNLLELNSQGFLNGHTPFSSLVSFISLLIAYLTNKKYIILSNEASANESNIEGTKINHQYSKTYEYENDFNNYVKENFKVDIYYFSLLRPISEYQIAYLFSKNKDYYKVFKSCNVGSKKENWPWCCSCAKCLFVYIILSPFLEEKELINIFGENLFSKEELLDIFLELCGKKENKPFECVGTYEEVNNAISVVINNYKGNLPYLLKYYKDNYELHSNPNILRRWNNENNLPEYFEKILRGNLDDK